MSDLTYGNRWDESASTWSRGFTGDLLKNHWLAGQSWRGGCGLEPTRGGGGNLKLGHAWTKLRKTCSQSLKWTEGSLVSLGQASQLLSREPAYENLERNHRSLKLSALARWASLLRKVEDRRWVKVLLLMLMYIDWLCRLDCAFLSFETIRPIIHLTSQPASVVSVLCVLSCPCGMSAPSPCAIWLLLVLQQPRILLHQSDARHHSQRISL